jgi:hypothetical protein
MLQISALLNVPGLRSIFEEGGGLKLLHLLKKIEHLSKKILGYVMIRNKKIA